MPDTVILIEFSAQPHTVDIFPSKDRIAPRGRSHRYTAFMQPAHLGQARASEDKVLPLALLP